MGGPQARCPACGTEPRARARFCDGCGSLLESELPPAEYKQVTVLFADVTRSMEIAAAVGPERLRDIMTGLFDRSTAVVHRFGGTVDKFIGDGIMALFGAPVSLEDHALRACLAAMNIQSEAERLAVEVAARDDIGLKVRIGLNSGEVIAGEIGSNTMNYTVIGEQVGMAQRMESVAPPGGVMLSESTARLVENATRLGEPERVRIKGAVDPVPARLLLGIGQRQRGVPTESALIGRRHEIGIVAEKFAAAITGRGCVVGVVGPPGIGKSRIGRGTATLAAGHGVSVFWSFCQSHSSGIPFSTAAELLRGFFGMSGLAADAARDRTRAAMPDADPEDLELLDDLLGTGDGQSAQLGIDPDARRRRLTRLLDTALLSRTEPAVYIIEDAHWIDEASESMLTDFITAVPQTHALVLVTYRPEYTGTLTAGAFTPISLAPLNQSESCALNAELLGTDPSVEQLAERIAQRAAGNPFFAEEIVRDLVERRVLEGTRGGYTCAGDAEVFVPATVQATIAARIDRLGPSAKRTLHAAAVIGSPFHADLLRSVVDEAVLAELVDAELIAQVTGTPAQYAFRHPLMRAVAYESQLKSDRAHLHRALASALASQDRSSADANAALIATHLEAAGDLHGAFDWRMRAGTQSTQRDISAARMNWQRAVAVADRLPDDDPDRLAMQIAPRTLLCATIWRLGGELADVGFDELRELTTAAGDKRSQVIGMSGMVQMLNFHGEYTEASRLAAEHVELLESIGDPELTVGLLPMVGSVAKWDAGEMTEALRMAQRAIDLSGGDPTMGNMIIGSPLAMALVMRASTRCCLAIPGWRKDFDDALEIARAVDKFTYSTVVMFKYITALNWALLPDDAALRDTAEALEIAKQFGDNFLLTNAEFTYGLVLVRRDDTDRALGFQLLAKARRVALEHRYTVIAAWCVDLDVATEKVRTGDFDGAIALSSAVLDNELRSGECINRGWATTVLVEALLARNKDGDLGPARAAVDQLAAMPTEPVFLYHELPLLRLRAMLARARGDETGYRDYRDQYRARAEEVGFDGHITLGRAMD